MDKNKNKNKTNVLRSSRIIKIKAIGLNTNYGSFTMSLSNSQQEEVNLPLQKLSKLLNLQDSDLQILSDILKTTATSIDGLKIVLDRNNSELLRVLKNPNQSIIRDVLNFLSSYIKKIKEILLIFTAKPDEKVVLKKLNDELSRPLETVEIEIKRNLLLIVYYYSK